MSKEQYNLRIKETLTLEDAFEELPEHITFNSEAVSILNGILVEVAANNTERPYHNKNHAVQVMKRSFKIWRNLQQILPHTFDDKGYELLAFAAASHDVYQEYTVPGQNEYQSAVEASLLTNACLSEVEQNRVSEAIIATTVRRREDGVIEQHYLQQGSRDPLKFVLATADINGIALEGVPRMIEDAVNLFLEFNSLSLDTSFVEHSKAIGEFLKTQASFLQSRLLAVPDDIEYYFPISENEERHLLVKNMMQELFKPSVAALSVAHLLELPDRIEALTSLLAEQVRTVKELPSRIIELFKPTH